MQENESNTWHYEEQDGRFVKVEGPAQRDGSTIEEVEDIIVSMESASPSLIDRSKVKNTAIAGALSLFLAISLSMGIHNSKQSEVPSVAVEQDDTKYHEIGETFNQYTLESIEQAGLLPQMTIEHGFSSLIDVNGRYGTFSYQPSENATFGTLYLLSSENQLKIVEKERMNDYDLDQFLVEIIDSKEDGQENIVYANVSEMLTKAVRIDSEAFKKAITEYRVNDEDLQEELKATVNEDYQALYDSYREVALNSSFYFASDKNRELKYNIVCNYFANSIVAEEEEAVKTVAYYAIQDGLQSMKYNVLEATTPVFPEEENQSEIYQFYRNQTAQYPVSADDVFDRLEKDVENGIVSERQKDIAVKGIAAGYQINQEMKIAIEDIKDKLNGLDVPMEIQFDDTELRNREVSSYTPKESGMDSKESVLFVKNDSPTADQTASLSGEKAVSHTQVKKVR